MYNLNEILNSKEINKEDNYLKYKDLIRPNSLFELQEKLFSNNYKSIKNNQKKFLFSPKDLMNYKNLNQYEVSNIFLKNKQRYIQLSNDIDTHFFIDEGIFNNNLYNNISENEDLEIKLSKEKNDIDNFLKIKNQRNKWLIEYGIYNDKIFETLIKYFKSNLNTNSNNYSNIITSKKFFTKDEFLKLNFKYNEYSNKIAKFAEIILKNNMNFIKYFAHKARKENPNNELDDLIQEGSIGFLKSLYEFDKNVSSLSTYASYRIKANIYSYCKKNTKIKYPIRHFSNFYNVKSAINELNTNESLKISNYTGISLKKVNELKKEEFHYIFSLDEPNETKNNYHELIPSNSFLDPFIEEKNNSNKRLIKKIIEPIPQKNKNIFKKHFYENKSYNEIAREYNITKQRVDQIIQKTLRKIRIQIKSNGLKISDF
ncbi:MAG: sigma-70 family RNA polymerase sigma factor [Nanoarchaeota archaeon]